MSFTFNPLGYPFDKTHTLGFLDSRYLKLDASNDPITGQLLIQPATDTQNLILKHSAAGTTAKIFEAQGSDGTVLASIGAGGHTVINTSSNGVAFSITGGTGGYNIFQATSNNGTLSGYGFAVDSACQFAMYAAPATSGSTNRTAPTMYFNSTYWNGSASVTEGFQFQPVRYDANPHRNAMWFRGSDTTVAMAIGGGGGQVTVGYNFPGSALLTTYGQLGVFSLATTTPTLTLNAIAAQTANMTTWKASSGTEIASVNKVGAFSSTIYGSSAIGNQIAYNATYYATDTSNATAMSFNVYRRDASGTFTNGFVGTVSVQALTQNTSANQAYAGLIRFDASAAAGLTSSTSDAVGLYVQPFNNGGATGAGTTSITRMYGIRIDNQANAAIGTSYGLYLGDQSGSGTTYSLYTGIGVNRLGDQLSIVGSADKIQTIIKGVAGQTANLMEFQNSSGTLLSAFGSTGNLGVNTSPQAVYSIYAQKNNTTANHWIGMGFDINHLYNSASYSSWGISGNAYTTLATGTIGALYGAQLGARNQSSNNATVNELAGLIIDYGNLYGIGTGQTTGTAYGIKVSALSKNAGTINNGYGIWIGDVNQATNSSSITTNAGHVVFNEGGDGSTDFRVESDTEANMIFLDANADTDGVLYFGGSTNALKVNKGGDTYFIGSGSGLPFGSCYGNEIGWTQASAVQDTWYLVSDTDMADGQLNLVTHDGSGKLTVTKAGMYHVLFTSTIECSLLGKHVQVGISVNGASPTQGINHFEIQTPQAQIELSGNAILSLTANQTIEVAMRTTDTGTPDLTCDHLNITIVQIGA